MRAKKETIYSELVKYYQNNKFTDQDIFNQINEKPICVHINETVSQYENIHKHNYYEILYVKTGLIKYLINDKLYNVNAGSLILIPPDTNHKLASFEENESSRFVLLFSNKFLKKYSTNNTNLFSIFNKSKSNNTYILSFSENSKIELEKTLLTTSNIMLYDDFGADLFYIQNFIKSLVIISYESFKIEEEKDLFRNKNAIITKIADYINNNISQKILLEDIAKHLSLSISRISHIFKIETGMTILEYINKQRLSLAKELIYQGETFTHIAAECGFQDYTSFFRTFKKETGITPGEYAKNARILNN